MFVQYLNERQQSALLHYAHEVMRADSAVDASELVQLEVLRDQAQPGVQAEDVAIEKLPELFDDRMSRIALMFELIGMGYADEKFHPRESELINKIANTLGIDEDGMLDDIVSWVKRQLLLVKEAHRLMEG